MKRFYLLLFCLIVCLGSFAQGKKKSKTYNKKANENSQFLEKQWWLGFKAGTNISKAVVLTAYSVMTPTDPTDKVSKKYENYQQFGSQAALEFTFSYQSLSISIQPTYRNARFVYSNKYEWIDTQSSNADYLLLNYRQEQKIEHAVVPLVVKYEVAGNKLKPYVQLGGYAAFLLNAQKTLTISGIDKASGGTNNFKDPAITVGAKDLFAKNNWGLIAGAGLNYHLGNVRFNFDVMYLYGMSNISSTKNRYKNDRLSGVGDALDDTKLNNLSMSLGCLFPLRFLGTGFKSFDK